MFHRWWLQIKINNHCRLESWSFWIVDNTQNFWRFHKTTASNCWYWVDDESCQIDKITIVWSFKTFQIFSNKITQMLCYHSNKHFSREFQGFDISNSLTTKVFAQTADVDEITTRESIQISGLFLFWFQQTIKSTFRHLFFALHLKISYCSLIIRINSEEKKNHSIISTTIEKNDEYVLRRLMSRIRWRYIEPKKN